MHAVDSELSQPSGARNPLGKSKFAGCRVVNAAIEKQTVEMQFDGEHFCVALDDAVF
jgi:hypothetical protein